MPKEYAPWDILSYVSQLPMRARREKSRQLRDVTRGSRQTAAER